MIVEKILQRFLLINTQRGGGSEVVRESVSGASQQRVELERFEGRLGNPIAGLVELELQLNPLKN